MPRQNFNDVAEEKGYEVIEYQLHKESNQKTAQVERHKSDGTMETGGTPNKLEQSEEREYEDGVLSCGVLSCYYEDGDCVIGVNDVNDSGSTAESTAAESVAVKSVLTTMSKVSASKLPVVKESQPLGGPKYYGKTTFAQSLAHFGMCPLTIETSFIFRLCAQLQQ